MPREMLTQKEVKLHRLWDAMLKAKFYRSYLKSAFRIEKEFNPNFSYSYFSKRAAISSRSFPRDVILGEKRLTARSLPKFLKGLGLKGDLKTAFQCMVALEENVDFKGHSAERIRKTLEVSIERIANKLSDRKSESANIRNFNVANWPYVYAALGSKEEGAILNKIISMTGLNPVICKRTLDQMVLEGVVIFDIGSDKYYPQSLNIVVDRIGENQLYMQYFIESMDRAKTKAKSNFSNRENLFLNSIVSVKKSELNRVREDMKNIMVNYISDVEDKEGDKLLSILAVLT